MTKMMIITTTLMIRRWTTTSPPPYLQRAGTHCLFRQGGFIDHNPHDDQFCHMIIMMMIMQGAAASLLIMFTIQMISRNNNIVTRITMNSFNRNLPPSFWDSSWVSPSLPREEAYQDPYSGSLLRQILGQSGYFGPTCAIWTILGHPEPFL